MLKKVLIKKELCVYLVSLAVLLVTILSQGNLSAFAFQSLKEGMQSDRVLQLQKDLKSLGHFSDPTTGYYGAATKSAVISFQKKYKISATGVYGPLTDSKLNSLLNEKKSSNSQDETLKEGMSGEKVLQLQKNLKSLGYFSAPLTGYFGSATKSAVINFQKKYKISPTGNFGPLTSSKLNSLLRSPKAKVVLDAGHGGIDPGALKNGVVEKEVNLYIAKLVRDQLVSKNYSVVMTRSTDNLLTNTSSKNYDPSIRDLDNRVKVFSSSNANFFVSIHVNSLPHNPSKSGSIVFYNPNSSKSKTLALSIQKSLNNMVVNGKQRSKNSTQSGNFYILKKANIPGVLVETAFITNSTENKLLKQKEFRSNIASAIVQGIEASGLSY